MHLNPSCAPGDSLRPGLLVVLVLTSCGDGEKPHRGIQLMPDMFDTPAYKRQVAMVIKKEDSSDGKEQHWPSLLPPVAGTVSRNGPTYQLAPTDFIGAQKLINPSSPTTLVLREGQMRYGIYCAVCHGRDGNAANGYVAKYFTGVPSLNAAHLARSQRCRTARSTTSPPADADACPPMRPSCCPRAAGRW